MGIVISYYENLFVMEPTSVTPDVMKPQPYTSVMESDSVQVVNLILGVDRVNKHTYCLLYSSRF